MKREDFKVLVPSLGILLFNKTFGFSRTRWSVFSSPLWGFFYLIHLMVIWVIFLKFSSPLWGFFYLMKNYKIKTKNKGGFSSPLWGFFYLIMAKNQINFTKMVLVPSLGILLFNNIIFSHPWELIYVLVPSLGILLFNGITAYQCHFVSVLVPSLGILLFNPVLENSDKHLAILYVCD